MTTPIPLPDTAFLRECLSYEPDTGRLVWKRRPLAHFKNTYDRVRWNNRWANTEAGNVCEERYRRIFLGPKLYQAHRIAWAIYYGEDPGEMQVDHINRDKTDNRIENLRLVDGVGNQRNCKRRGNNSGVTGVYYMPSKEAYKAEIGVGGKLVFLGLFKTLEAAAAARQGAERVLGFSEHHGRAA